MKDRFDQISLGQGQHKYAEELINLGKTEGKWILLQNCHLFKSWMVDLEQIVLRFEEEKDQIHDEF